MEDLNILSVARLRGGTLTLDDEVLARCDGRTGDVLRELYDALGPGDPRFFKMDRCSKLAVLATEPLFRRHAALVASARERIGIVHQSDHGSLDTDLRYHQRLIDSGEASPAVFVHTLPNIPVAEITIRHKLPGPSICCLGERPDAGLLRSAGLSLVRGHGVRALLLGWSDIFAFEAEATFILAGPGPGSPFSTEQLQRYLD